MQVSLPHWVIYLFIWLPEDYGAIFAFLLEMYLQLMVLKKALKTHLFQKAFPS